MRICLIILLLLIAYFLVANIRDAYEHYQLINSCVLKVKAKCLGYVSYTKGNNAFPYRMKVRFELGLKDREALLLDEKPLEYFEKNTHEAYQSIYVDPTAPRRAILFKNEALKRDKRIMIVSGIVASLLIIGVIIIICSFF